MRFLTAALAIWFLWTALAGWAFMLAIGVVHHEWIPDCPTIGFGWSLLLAFLLRLALASPSGSEDR